MIQRRVLVTTLALVGAPAACQTAVRPPDRNTGGSAAAPGGSFIPYAPPTMSDAASDAPADAGPPPAAAMAVDLVLTLIPSVFVPRFASDDGRVAGVAPSGASLLGASAAAPGAISANAQITAMTGDGSIGAATIGSHIPNHGPPFDVVPIVAPYNCSEEAGALAAIWDAGGVPRSLGTLDAAADSWSCASGMSADGHFIVGMSGHGTILRGFWTAETPLIAIDPIPPDDGSGALAVSALGDVVLAVSFEEATRSGRLFLWRPDAAPLAISPPTPAVVPASLGGFTFLAGLYNAFLSADGSSVAGTIVDGDGPKGFRSHAFHWTARTGLVTIPPLVGMSFATALGISPDGTTVVGFQSPDGSQLSSADAGFRWTAADGSRPLSPFAGVPYLASPDASHLAELDPPTGALSIVTTDGVQQLTAVGATTIMSACPTPFATAISNDGRTLAGVCDGFEATSWIGAVR